MRTLAFLFFLAACLAPPTIQAQEANGLGYGHLTEDRDFPHLTG